MSPMLGVSWNVGVDTRDCTENPLNMVELALTQTATEASNEVIVL